MDILKSNLSGAAVSWLNNVEYKIERGERAPHNTWLEFAQHLIDTFQHIDDSEAARNELHRIKQTGQIGGYVDAFQRLKFRIPSLGNEEAYTAFMRGLKPEYARQLMTTGVRDLELVMQMAERIGGMEEFLRTPNRQKRGGGGGGFRGRRKPKPQGKGGGNINATKRQPDQQGQGQGNNDSNAALNRQGQGQGNRQRQPRKEGNRQGGNGNRDKNRRKDNDREKPLVCRFCGKSGHRVQDCQEMHKAAKAFKESRKN